jgi:hypothetical protein
MSPLMWPLLALASPVLVPKMLRRNRIFKENRSRAESLNRQRIDGAQHLDLPELDFRELTVLVDENRELVPVLLAVLNRRASGVIPSACIPAR